MGGTSFSFKQFTILQDRCAMKVGTDGTLLGTWAEAKEEKGLQISAANEKEALRILDIGTGTGLCAIMMAQRFPDALITAIDIDCDASLQARSNAAASPFGSRINVIHTAVQDFQPEVPFDAIVCNPPYFENSLTCPDSQRTVSRHTTTLTFLELMRSAIRLLSADGILSLVIPYDALPRMEEAAALTGFFLKKQCAVKTTATKLPKRVLLSYSPNPIDTLPIKEELIIGSAEYKELTKEFYL